MFATFAMFASECQPKNIIGSGAYFSRNQRQNEHFLLSESKRDFFSKDLLLAVSSPHPWLGKARQQMLKTYCLEMAMKNHSLNRSFYSS